MSSLTKKLKENRNESQTSHDLRPVLVDCRIRMAKAAAGRIRELHERIGHSLAQLGYRGEYWLTAGFRTTQQDASWTYKPVEEIHINLANPLKKRASKIRSLLSPLFQTIPGVVVVQNGMNELRLELPNGSSWTKERIAPDVGRKDHAPSDSTAPTAEPTATTSSNPATSRRPERSGNSPTGGSSYNKINGRRIGEEGEGEEGGEESEDEEGHEENGKEGGEEEGGEEEGSEEEGGGQDPNEDDHDPSSQMDSQLLAEGARIHLPLSSKIVVKPSGEPNKKLQFALEAAVTVEVNNNLAERDYPFDRSWVHGPWVAIDVHNLIAYFRRISDSTKQKPHYPELLTFHASTTPEGASPHWDPNEHVVKPTTKRQDRAGGLKYLLQMGAKPSASIEASHNTTTSQDLTKYPYKSGVGDEDTAKRVFIEYTKKDKAEVMEVRPPHAPQIFFMYNDQEVEGGRQLVIKTSALWSSRREWRSTGDTHPPLLYHNFTQEMKCELDLNALCNDQRLYSRIPKFVDSTDDVGILQNETRRDFEAKTVEVGASKFTVDRSIVGEVNPAPHWWKRFFKKRK